jgi:excisionase family DNA binding protein
MKRNQNKDGGASSMHPKTDRLITKREVADRLGVCTRSVERLVNTGELNKQMIGRAVRFRLFQVLNLGGLES